MSARTDVDDSLSINADGSVYDSTEDHLLADCECDNTHEQNQTVCRYCWAYGVRYTALRTEGGQMTT